MLPLLLAGGAAAAGGLSSILRNRARPKPPDIQPYQGYRPPHIDYTNANGENIANLRPVQQQITDILMKRSRGEDVGYDPRLLTSATASFDATQAQQAERAKEDINNELSGTGQSRNLAARAMTLGRFGQDQQRQKTQFLSDIDVANLERANQEKQSATTGLQNLNTFDFGQENNAANFDLAAYNAENQAKLGGYGAKLQDFNAYQDPAGSAIQSGLGVYGAEQGFAQNGAISSYLRSLAAQNQNLLDQQNKDNTTKTGKKFAA